MTPQADLYSLGAMLYDLVTGQPPFVGDDPTAIISQHLNTAPVRPSLRSAHRPPALDALILNLLAKAPNDRPASAPEVLATLEGVDPEASSASDSQLNPLERLARGVFVGREQELERLREPADEAFADRGSVVMLVGEPGIGKTRTAQELETYARMRGAQVLWGRAHEASAARAYWPWVQVGRVYGSSVDEDTLRGQLGARAEELQRLFPELRQMLPDLSDAPAAADESAPFRLFDAYTSFFRDVTRESPQVIVLDDLHWADKPTLFLLQHFARELANMRLLVVGTYRDTELARTHPLDETLAELNHEGGFQRVVLRGLDEPEVRAYLAATTGREPSRELSKRVCEETEGYPFLLSEVVNLMTEEGSFEADSVPDIALPVGVREALGRRLDRLSEEANDLLTTASVVGREFEYETLSLLMEHDDETLLGLIEEGLGARVLDELDRPGRYRFMHALMQETLLEELSTTRRVRLHGAVVEAQERRYGERSEERAATLAQHFVESATLNAEHAEKAARYAQLAAGHAEAVNAWDEAARMYRLALALDERSDSSGSEIDAPQTLLLLRVLLRITGDQLGSGEALVRAGSLFQDRADVARMARTAIAMLQLGVSLDLQQAIALAEDAIQIGLDADPELLTRLLARRAWDSLGFDEVSNAAAKRASALASELGLNDVQSELLDREAHRSLHEARFADGRALARERFAVTERLGNHAESAHALFEPTFAYLSERDLDGANDGQPPPPTTPERTAWASTRGWREGVLRSSASCGATRHRGGRRWRRPAPTSAIFRGR